jgi:ATP-dependent helicase/nuclease subunit A
MGDYQLNYNNSSWIIANAGSGKTYILARRVIRLMLEGAPPESILCLTYTKAAAAEMRQRILKLLSSLTIFAGQKRIDLLINILGEPPSPEALTLAPELYARVLDSPSGGIPITTLHGFCQQLLKAFPFEANIPPHAEVMDEAQEAELMQLAIRRLYRLDVKRAPELAEALSFLAGVTAEQRLESWLKHLLRERRRWEAVLAYPDSDAIMRALRTLCQGKTSHPEEWRARCALMRTKLGAFNA